MGSVTPAEPEGGVQLSPAERLARAVLLFYSPGPWEADQRLEWRRLTSTTEATTRNLCDLAREVRRLEESR